VWDGQRELLGFARRDPLTTDNMSSPSLSLYIARLETSHVAHNGEK
jgi:hypothetical protein